jgi:hypothetical protein
VVHPTLELTFSISHNEIYSIILLILKHFLIETTNEVKTKKVYFCSKNVIFFDVSWEHFVPTCIYSL